MPLQMKALYLSVLATTLFLSGSVAAFEECGDLKTGGYGPFDYWTDQGKLKIVEDFHFTPEVESLRKGKSGYIGGDLDYTLRAFPNHPRALMAMIKLGEKEKTNRPIGAGFSVFCYLDRAIRFRPEDATVRMIAATYLAKRGKHEEALKHLETAQQHGGENANLHYNIGLTYFELKRYDAALTHAHKAYRLGFQLPGLRNKLQRVGKWQEPSPLAPVENADETAPEPK